jgi:phosphatidylinositol alpha-1,6-mannosyltransferase
VTTPTLLLTPSHGLGGGIERYVETVEWAFKTQGVDYTRIDLAQPRASGHARILARSSGHLRTAGKPTRLVLAHRALLPVASLLTRRHPVSGISVVCHGSDVWGSSLRPRWYLEQHLMRRCDVRVVAVSSYTAGALARGRRATILPPGLSLNWFHELASARDAARGQSPPGLRILTAFRLGDWRDKGLPELVEALTALRRNDVMLEICGSGEPPPDLIRFVGYHRRCVLNAQLDDRELASRLAAADLFVLATRTRSGSRASGEGFGLVLLEAQVAGTPVVGPAYGGSRDAYVDGVTGLTPTDESPETLALLLDGLLRDTAKLARMGERAAQWAGERFAPEQYAALVVKQLL